jgi:hypothetical protein
MITLTLTLTQQAPEGSGSAIAGVKDRSLHKGVS